MNGKTGRPLVMTPERIEQDFWSKVDTSNGLFSCWEWTGKTNGAGRAYQYTGNGMMEPAARYSWTLCNGKIPHGMCILHTCDNPLCVNPAHLFMGTQKDNLDDMTAKGHDNRWGHRTHTNRHCYSKDVSQ